MGIAIPHSGISPSIAFLLGDAACLWANTDVRRDIVFNWPLRLSAEHGA
jgi:hypothetical protein